MRTPIQTVLLAMLAVGIFGSTLKADLTGPRSSDQRIVFIVSKLIQGEHIAKPELNDEISRRIASKFIEGYDPFKLYFTQSDVDVFNKKKDQLDDLLKAKDLSFPYEVFRKLLTRIEERVKLAEELLDAELDFAKDEQFTTEPDEIKYVQAGEKMTARWRRRIKYDLLQLKADEVEIKEAKDRLRKRYTTFLSRMKQTDDDDLVERYLNNVAASLDPHSSYFSPNTLEDFRIRLGLNYQGIGAELEEKEGAATIRRIIPGGAAEEAGELKAGDQIVEVGQGAEGEMVKVVEERLSDIIDKIRGPEGTIVRMGVIPAGEKKMKIYSITRAKITLADNAAKGKIIEQEGKDGPVKVGVIDLRSFYVDMSGAKQGRGDYTSTTRDVRKILGDFRTKDVDVVLLDLRHNGGGSLSEAIRLTGLFIDIGPVVQVKDSAGRIEKYDDPESGMEWDGPLVVATSRFSASASEILAGAIQDYGRGIIVGDPTTHGKGTVQSLLELGPRLFGFRTGKNLGALKITIQKFYRPNGESTQRRGVKSDVVIPSLTTHISDGEADLDYALAFDKVPEAKHKNYAMLTNEIVRDLSTASATRRKASKDFKELTTSIADYVKQKKRHSVPLNEKAFLARQGELEARRKELAKLQDSKSDDYDFLLNEITAVAGDYFASLGDKTKASPK
jgi:carboxyl-terminal processing protease